MKTKANAIVAFCAGVLVLASLSGCFVQSIHPFYTDTTRISPPQMAGEWDFISAGTDDLTKVKVNPWVFSEKDGLSYEVESYNKNNAPGNLKAVFFKVGDQIFCDWLAGDLPNPAPINEYWTMNVRPVHTVTKVTLTNDVLTFTGLDYDWMSQAMQKREVKVAFIGEQEFDGRSALPLFTASPQEWSEFLKKHGGNTNAFPGKLSYVFKKRKINDQIEATDQPKTAPKDKPSSK